MIVWGGGQFVGAALDSGGQYCACASPHVYFRDSDGDGHGDPAVSKRQCGNTIPSGYVADNTDCNDTIPSEFNPPTAIVSGGGSICKGGSINIRADLTGTGPWNLAWSDGFVQNGVSTSPATRPVSPASTTSYSVTSISDLGCSGSSTGSAQVTVIPVPSETAAGSTPGTIQEWNDSTQMHWPSNPTATSYKLYRGQKSDLPNLLTSSIDSCLLFQGTATTYSESMSPGVDELFWYLVTGVANGCEGSAGYALIDQTPVERIVNASGACP